MNNNNNITEIVKNNKLTDSNFDKMHMTLLTTLLVVNEFGEGRPIGW
jgi:hypothetical protein